MSITRDMSDKQFLAALKRNSFGRPVLFWCEDKTIPGVSYSIIVSTKGKIFKRQTLANLLHARKREMAARTARQREKASKT